MSTQPSCFDFKETVRATLSLLSPASLAVCDSGNSDFKFNTKPREHYTTKSSLSSVCFIASPPVGEEQRNKQNKQKTE